MWDGSFFAELRRRKVLQAAAIYGAVAWGVTEVVVTVVEQLFLPQWVATLAVIGFVVGFPVAMFLAWTFDFTSEGIRRTAVSSRRGKASIVLSMLLLVAGTAGLFFLIRPSLVSKGVVAADVVSILPNSIAVLPFENAGLDPGDSYLSEGLSDELRDELGRVKGLRIAARSSSKVAVERGLDALEASKELRVANIIEGNVRHQGAKLRVSVQLIEGSSGLSLWSETFERRKNELLSVQQAIADAVVSRMLPGSPEAVAEPATRNANANDLMVLARSYEKQVRERQDFDVDLLKKAIELYRAATEADPDSALAHSRLAGVLAFRGDVDAADAEITKAVLINPNLSEVQNTLGVIYWQLGREEAGTAWARAVELNPNNPDALSNYARWRWKRIQIEGVREFYWRALELDPLNLERYGELGIFLATENHTEEAREIVTRMEGLFDGASAFRALAEVLDYLGEVDQSIGWTIRARNLEPDNPSHVQKLAEYYADIGDTETALRLDPNGIGILFKSRRYDEMIDMAEFAMIDEPGDLRIRSLLAIAYNATGQYESAINALRETGLPDSVFNGWRSTAESDGYQALENALYAIGEIEDARGLAHFMVYTLGYTPGNEWILTIGKACDLAILGEDDEARRSLQQARKGLHLAWDPILKDAPCFKRFLDDPTYQATVRYFDDRRVMLRERLPATLAKFGVSL